MIENFTPTLFDQDRGCKLRDMRFTTNDLRNAIAALGVSYNYTQVVSMAEREIGSANMERWDFITVVGDKGGSRTSPGYILTGEQAMRCLAGLTGDAGRSVRASFGIYVVALEDRLELMKTLAAEQAAELANLRGQQAIAKKVTDEYFAKIIAANRETRELLASMPTSKKQSAAYEAATAAEQTVRNMRGELTLLTGATASALPPQE